MNAKFKRNYTNQNGNTVFVYEVDGNKEQLAKFKEAQGDYHREDENGKPLWFTTRFIGKTGNLVITSKGKVVPDMSAFEQANSLAKQYGGNLGAELAKTAASQLLGNRASSDSTEQPAPKQVSAEFGDAGEE